MNTLNISYQPSKFWLKIATVFSFVLLISCFQTQAKTNTQSLTFNNVIFTDSLEKLELFSEQPDSKTYRYQIPYTYYDPYKTQWKKSHLVIFVTVFNKKITRQNILNSLKKYRKKHINSTKIITALAGGRKGIIKAIAVAIADFLYRTLGEYVKVRVKIQ